jgi:hypothetical protein
LSPTVCEEDVNVEPASPLASTTSGSVLVGAITAVVKGDVDVHDETSARILDAAYEMFCHIGIQRSTMEDVARRAGISRITVYRRFATKGALVDQLVRREVGRYLDQFASTSSRPRRPPTGWCWGSPARCGRSAGTR